MGTQHGRACFSLTRHIGVPANDQTRWVCERFLAMLADQFSSTQAKVDTTTFNAARICTLYGTVKRKGSDIPEQPHRQSKLVHVPDPLEPVDWKRLAALVEPYPGQQAAQQVAGQPIAGTSGLDVDQMLQQRGVEYSRDDRYQTQNGELATRYVLEICPWNADHNDRAAWIVQWANGAIAAGCHHDGCAGRGWQDLQQVWHVPSEITAADIILPQQPVVVQPQLQSLYCPPAIPQAAFHGPIGQLVQQFAPNTEASPMAMLVTLLTYYGNAIGRRYYVDIGTRQFLKLFTVLVGTTARGRKWTAEENVCRMVDAINPAWAIYRHSGLASGEGMLQTVADQMEGITPAPAVFTEGEFALVLRKKERKGNSLDGYLRVAWDDAPLSTATRSNPLRVEGSHISLLVHITPSELKELLTSRDISNGFCNRFLWVWSARPAKVQHATSFQPTEEYQPHIVALQQAFAQVNQQYDGEPIRLRLNAAAQQAWQKIYAYLDNVESDEDEGLLVDMNARAPAYVQRIAAIYALADGASEISTQHLKAAVAVTDYSLATVDYVYSKVWWTDRSREFDVIQQRSVKVLNALSTNQPVMRTEVSSGICKRNRSAAELNQIRDHLVSTGCLRIEQAEHTEQWIRLH